jgi:hypothetical protein
VIPPYQTHHLLTLAIALVDTAVNLQTYVLSAVLPVFKRSWF